MNASVDKKPVQPENGAFRKEFHAERAIQMETQSTLLKEEVLTDSSPKFDFDIPEELRN
jgi:hypothetical protein